MKSKRIFLRNFFLFFLVLSMGYSCVSISNLNVDYHLSVPVPNAISDREIALVYQDEREVKSIIGQGAMKDFSSFSGQISLALVRNSGNRIPVGIFDPGSLFIEVFTRKLEELGVKVSSDADESNKSLIIVLKEFNLDLIKRKWVVKIAYEAKVEKDNHIIYRHNINGDGERLKIMGSSQADELISEIFSDVINRLDLEKLFNL